MPKKKNTTSGAPGSKGAREAWNEQAAKANGAKPKKAKGEQMKIKVDAGDTVRVPAKHELHRAMTDAEWDEQAALLAKNRVELMGIEDEIRRLKEKHALRVKELRGLIDNGARQCDAREWLTMVDCIEVHDPNTRQVVVYADVNGELGAQVKPPRLMSDEEYERAIQTSPFEPPAPLDPPDTEPIDIEDPAGE